MCFHIMSPLHFRLPNDSLTLDFSIQFHVQVLFVSYVSLAFILFAIIMGIILIFITIRVELILHELFVLLSRNVGN